METLLLIDCLPVSLGYVDVRNLCLPFGEVRWSKMRTRRKGHALQLAYVEMADQDGAERAQRALHGMLMGKARLRVRRRSVTLESTFGLGAVRSSVGGR
jgi:RNA recognition motif-containing protein